MTYEGIQLELSFEDGFTGKSPCCNRYRFMPQSVVAFLLAMRSDIHCSCILVRARDRSPQFTVSLRRDRVEESFDSADEAAAAFCATIADGRCDCVARAQEHEARHRRLLDSRLRATALSLGWPLEFVEPQDRSSVTAQS